jgi:hypothetical protein
MNTEVISAWEDDPGSPDMPNMPVEHGVPDIGKAPLPSELEGPDIAPGKYGQGTRKFRYWAAADALRRVADFWGPIVGLQTEWHPTVGPKLKVHLDQGAELNANYDRQGLNFFHGSVAGNTFYSGESPDVVCHEFGHAVLDAVQPRLWGVLSAEPPALHEAFGDISALLSVLQLPSMRDYVLNVTSGRIERSTRLSRLAEQLGWAIRQQSPQAVEADCLRNASNALFYQDPVTLPPMAPASSLSSEPHSFSRVFSGAFLRILAGMLEAQPTLEGAALEQVTHDAAALLIDAVRAAPISVAYYSQLAAHMLAADQANFGGKYASALRAGFVRHGVLSLEHATSPMPVAPLPAAAMAPVGGAVEVQNAPLTALAGEQFGLDRQLLVQAPSEPKRYAVASAGPDLGAAPQVSHDVAAVSYVEDLFRRGHVWIEPELRTGREVVRPATRATHELHQAEDGLLLERRLFECGFC